MEMVIPLFALSALYVATKQPKTNNIASGEEGFQSDIPNADIPDRNYPDDTIISAELDRTSYVSKNNRFENAGGVYTDKYFSTDVNTNVFNKNTLESVTNPQAEYYSLTGKRVDGSYFQHNNMVPFFGSNLRNVNTDNNKSESVLDNYVGAGSQHVKKSEQAPLFAPAENQQWAYGAPNSSDFYQSRVNPSMRMANVRPFADEKVGPGLGLGYTTAGSGGFNSGMMTREAWLDKTVDQLRVDSNPKPGGHSLLGHEGPANSYIKTMGGIGTVEKNRPETTAELGRDRLFVTTGIGKGETARAIPVTSMRHTVREDSTTDYIGNANSSVGGEYIKGQYMEPNRQTLDEFPLAPANATGRNFAHDADFEIKAKTAYPNNRSVNAQETYFGMVSGGLNAAVAPLLDALRPTRKENAVGNLRPYQNAKGAVSEGYLFDPNDRPGTTIRETTENSKFHYNVGSNVLQNGGAYETTPQTLPDTMRQSTSDYYYAGNASAGERNRQMKSYEAEYNQRNNDIKSSTIDGRMVPGNMSLLNSDINMSLANRDDMLFNTRDVAGTMPYRGADTRNMGQLQGGMNALNANIQMERNTPDMYTALGSNPFVVNYKTAL
jgi:hypothetical protein